LTAAFAKKQSGRGLVGNQTTTKVIDALGELYKIGGNREDARKMFGVAKWVYEASKEKKELLRKMEVRSIEEFVGLLSAGK